MLLLAVPYSMRIQCGLLAFKQGWMNLNNSGMYANRASNGLNNSNVYGIRPMLDPPGVTLWPPTRRDRDPLSRNARLIHFYSVLRKVILQCMLLCVKIYTLVDRCQGLVMSCWTFIYICSKIFLKISICTWYRHKSCTCTHLRVISSRPRQKYIIFLGN